MNGLELGVLVILVFLVGFLVGVFVEDFLWKYTTKGEQK
jgi:uncharacterized protein YneF (UPF0154 family)